MNKVFVPPIKIQGIKTKLIPFIIEHAHLDNQTVWIEPFMGSGVVGFNVRPQTAVFADINPHLINFYNAVKHKRITAGVVKDFLTEQGQYLSARDNNYYCEVRERFNKSHSPLDFLFLNRCCFNGMIRFNRDGNFNVPYGHKPQRFSKAYVTKVVNQVKYVENCLTRFDWTFLCQDFRETINQCDGENAFIYCDPPYIGRHVDYYDSWNENDEVDLCLRLKAAKAKFMISTWMHNEYRENKFAGELWNFCNKYEHEHFYHVGAKESNRHSMTEAVLTNYPNECNINANVQSMFNFGEGLT